ncbi:hypothetical protein F66182_840 [Fusarium sp. NRRL 66182]|nr:hypothetical protein F66182_840 [Fusarium sp. NRRL 66182]
MSATATVTVSPETKRRGSWVPTRRKSECLVDISIDRHFEAKTYTSGSTVAGTVTLSPQTNTTFDAFEVIFTGSETAFVQTFHQSSMPKSGHKFLLLRMPIPQSALPESGVLQAGNTYAIPFSFVIPYQLPSAACRHQDPIIRERHLQLPPTVGSWEHDDMAVHTINVTYAVEARAMVHSDKKGKLPALQRTHPVKVIPFYPEQPPLHILPGNPRFTLSQERSIRKDMLSSKLGYLRATTRQPDPVTISPDKLQPSDCSVSVDLEFWPTSKKATPPEMYAKSATIKASTYYSTGHVGFLPDQHNYPSVMPNPILSFVLDESATVNPSQELVWESTSEPSPTDSRRGSENSNADDQVPQVSSRRGSKASIFDISSRRGSRASVFDIGSRRGSKCSDSQGGSRRGSKSSDIMQTEPPRHTATLPISVTLPSPDHKILLPTFYSCLISRTYILEIVLASRTHGSSFTLRVPLQIAVDGRNETEIDSIPTYEQVQAGQALDERLPTYEITIR